jgi:UDP-N-acetylmuramate--alanine ligase
VSAPREARSPGSGLAPGREARPIRARERIHVIGAAGAGASAAVLHAHWQGAAASGCDSGGPSPYTPAIEAAGIVISRGHDPAHVTAGRADRLAVTKALTAIDPDNPELAAARAAGVPVEPWQQIVADAAFGRDLVAVAGTHGKSTSAGWLVHVLAAAGLDPAAFVGALLPGDLSGGLPSTARRGSGRPFVVEADEYAGNFDAYRPTVTLLTSAEWDHPDVFADLDAVVACFHEWLELAARTAGRPILVANVADAGVAMVVGSLRNWPGTIVGTMLAGEASATPDRSAPGDPRDRFAIDGGPAAIVSGRILEAGPAGTLLEIAPADAGAGPFTVRLALAGRHNAANALGVAATANVLGAPWPAVVAALASFRGVRRRLERKGEGRGVVVYDDYGHHPTAIRETLAAIRQLEPGRRVWAVYEPLTYHRTAAMLEQFAEVLAMADAVAVADIWASRDPDTSITSAATLAQAVARRQPGIMAEAPGSVEETAAWLARQVRTGDAVLVMGGGRSYRIAELLLAALTG